MENKQLTLGSLFDGSGGFPLAGKLAGIKPVWASEVEPFPIAVTRKRLPEMKHYGDVSAINGADLEPVDIITGGFPCFPAGTLVLTDKGYIEIENVRVGMKVLTHKGQWRKVTATGSKEGKTIVLKGNHYGLECTPNHPIYSAKMKKYYSQSDNGKRLCWREVGKEKEWTAAKEMKYKLWAMPNTFEMIPINQPRYSGDHNEKPMPEFSEDFFYLVGRWLGYGWVRDNQRTDKSVGQRQLQIIICTRYEKEDALKAAMEAVIDGYSTERRRSTVKYKFDGRVFCNWLTENFGNYAYGKRIPSWAYSMSEKWRVALLKGICDKDGYLTKSGHIKITTISKKLAHGIRLLAETLGYSSTVYFDKHPKTRVIKGRTVKQRDTYTVNLAHSKMRMWLADKLHTWYRVSNIEDTGKRKTVYNITVEKDNSYIADDIVVHNCQDVSVAGKRAGLAGKRTGLFYEAARIIKEMREKTNGQYPRFFIAENVPGIYSSNRGEDFRAVLEEIVKIAEPEAPSLPMPEKGNWPYADVLLGDGWSVAYRTLDAQYLGTPQRRRRIYLVADFGGRSAGEVLFKSEGLSGYTPQSQRSWEGTPGNLTQSLRETGRDRRDAGERIALNDLNGQRVDVTDAPQQTVFGIGSFQSNAMLSDNPNSGIYEADTARTLDTLGGNPSCNQGGVCVVEQEFMAFAQNQRNEVRDLGDKSGALQAEPGMKQQTYVLQGNMIGRDDKNKSYGCAVSEDAAPEVALSDNSVYAMTTGYFMEVSEDKAPTLKARDYKDPTTVAPVPKDPSYGIDRAAFNQGQNAKFSFSVEEELMPTLVSRGPNAVSKPESNYTVRRLTPTECARLQGFPDWWCRDLGNPNPTDEELKFWMDVWETHRKVVSHNSKPKTEKQVRKWLADPYSDSAEYKLWGNGIQLNCAFFVLSGVVWAATKE